MADEVQLKLLLQGVEVWNKRRKRFKKRQIDFSGADLSGTSLINANLSEADFSGAEFYDSDLSGADLERANFVDAKLSGAKFIGANLSGAYFVGANLVEADFAKANLIGADFTGANLSDANFYLSSLEAANLSKADLSGANLSRARLVGANLPETYFVDSNLSEVDLSGAYLVGATFIRTSIEGTIFRNCRVYGLSVWDIRGIPANQNNLIITRPGEVEISVDNLEVAQFIYLLLKNEKLKDVIDTITSKVILILGRFTDERKLILNSIRRELRKWNFTPIIFDFDKPAGKDVSGTVETVARMARFIIADLTDPSSLPHELAILIPHLRTTPIRLIKLKGAKGYSMIEDFYSYPWVLQPYEYKDVDALLDDLHNVIQPANEMAERLRIKQ